MNKPLRIIIALALLISVMLSHGQTNYILPAQTGSGSGSDWANAKGGLTASACVRGHTYYYGGNGNYAGPGVFSAGDSGTTYIFVKKATLADHGTATGWSDIYTNTAFFSNGWYVAKGSDYYYFDGGNGGGPLNNWTNNFGTVITVPTNSTIACFGVAYNSSGTGDTGCHDITVRHFRLNGNSPNGVHGAYGSSQQGVADFWGSYNCTNSYIYVNDTEGNAMAALGLSNFVFEYIYVGHTWPQSGDHTEWCYIHNDSTKTIPVHNVTFRWCFFNNMPYAANTGGLVMIADPFYIYGNIVYRPVGTQWVYSQGCFGPQGGTLVCSNGYIYNNTVINSLGNDPSASPPNTGGSGPMYGFWVNGYAGGFHATNNLYYLKVGLQSPLETGGGGPGYQYMTEDYEMWCALDGTPVNTTGSHNYTTNSNPFVDYVNWNFNLTTTTPAGASVPYPYNIDMFGHTNTGRGALAFVGAVIPTYTVTYDSNTSTGGSVPVDSNDYTNTQTVTVLGNTGGLVKTGCTFNNWNLAADGSSTSYSGGNTFSIGAANVTMYARWTTNPVPTGMNIIVGGLTTPKITQP